MPFWKRGEEGEPPEGRWMELQPPHFPPDFPAPESEEDVAADLAGAIFLTQVQGHFPRCSGESFESAGLTGHGVIIRFDNRKQEDEAFRITVSKHVP